MKISHSRIVSLLFFVYFYRLGGARNIVGLKVSDLSSSSSSSSSPSAFSGGSWGNRALSRSRCMLVIEDRIRNSKARLSFCPLRAESSCESSIGFTINREAGSKRVFECGDHTKKQCRTDATIFDP